MAGIQTKQKDTITSDIILAWEAINNGVVDKNHNKRKKYWNFWEQYVQIYKKNSFLTDCTNAEQIIIITAFAARVRTGHYGRGNQVKVQSVKDALAAISKTIELAGERSPVYKADKNYKTPVARLIEGFKQDDPPPVPQIAIPVQVINQCLKAGYTNTCPIKRAIADLSVIAFFYLLRVGEYTKPTLSKKHKNKRATRTVQFKIQDIGFFKNNKILERNTPIQQLTTADSCTLKITNQKNGRMGQTIHQHSTHKDICPIEALARQVNHIITNNGSHENLLCDVWLKDENKWYQITPPDMIKHLREAVTSLKLDNKGITPDLVGVHSLRAGGAMALKLNGASDTTIMKMGRWTSMTFLEYIHNQIAHLSKNLSHKMSTQLDYQNIAAIERAA